MAGYSIIKEDKENGELIIGTKVSPKEFDELIHNAFVRSKSKFKIPGFRQGHVPFSIIEKTYGKQVFYSDAIEEAYSNLITAFLKESENKFLDEIIGSPQPKKMDITKEVGLDLEVLFFIKPAVHLGKYKGLGIKKDAVKISVDQVNAELKKLQDRANTYENENKAAQDGDEVFFDFLGKVDGVAFPGGEAKDYRLTLGSKTFIPGFEEQLIGVKAGDKKDVKVKFPDDYHAEELKSKEAIFECTIHDVFTLKKAELNDEFAKENSDCSTLDELKKKIKDDLTKKAEAEADAKLLKEIMDKIISDTKINLQNEFLEELANRKFEQLKEYYSNMHFELEKLLKYQGQTMQEFKDNIFKEQKNSFVEWSIMQAIGEVEKIEVTAEDIDNYLINEEHITKENLEKHKSEMSKEAEERMKTIIFNIKVEKFLKENN